MAGGLPVTGTLDPERQRRLYALLAAADQGDAGRLPHDPDRQVAAGPDWCCHKTTHIGTCLL